MPLGRARRFRRRSCRRVGRGRDGHRPRLARPPAGFKPLTSYKIANAYREFVTDEKLIADLRKRFEGYTGPAVNQGGVR